MSPSYVSCPIGQWTKVASSVTEGQLLFQTPGTEMRFIYAMTGGAAPTLLSHGAPVDSSPIEFCYDPAVDLYIWPTNQPCSVIVCLPGADPEPEPEE